MKSGDCGARRRSGSGADDLALGQGASLSPGKAEKREVLTRILREVGQLMVETRPVLERLGQVGRVIQSAAAALAMHDVIKSLIGQIVQWVTTGAVAENKIIHVGIPQARAIVRNKAGKKMEFGLAYLISRLGGGYFLGQRIAANADEKTDAIQALAGYRTIFGPEATPELVVYDRGGDSPHAGAAGVGGVKQWDSAQGAAGVASCRGSPRPGAQRAGPDRGIIGTLKSDDTNSTSRRSVCGRRWRWQGRSLSCRSI